MAATPAPIPSTKCRGRKRKSPSATTTTRRSRRRCQRHSSSLSPVISAISSALSAAHSFLLSHELRLLPSHSLSLESSLSSASISLTKLQSLLQIKPEDPAALPPQPKSWFERFLLLSENGDPRWVETFRMSKPTFSLLTSTLSESLSASLPSVPPNFALGAALYRLAHDGSFSSVGRRFGLSSADACRAFYTVCKVICDQMGGCLGDFGSEMGRVSAGFEKISLPNCCGVLGMEKFHVNGDVLGKNGFLMVQALVDSEGRFLDVSAGWPSTFNPSSFFTQTRLFLGVDESKELLNGSPFELSDGFLLPQYVLGDSCFPLLPWLLIPFEKKDEEELSFKEMEFNDVHKKAMGFVRTAFQRVRANWKVLKRRWKEDSVEFLPFIIITACLLNNFLVKHGETLLDGEPDFVEEHDLPEFEGEVRENAGSTRDLLAMHLSWVSQRQ